MKDLLQMIIYFGWAYSVSAFSTTSPTVGRKILPRLPFSNIRYKAVSPSLSELRCVRRNSSCCSIRIKHISEGAVASMFFALMLHIAVLPAFADEYGVEKEAPTIFTGETVEICTKRGPLGACLKTEVRTQENDNDVAKKYFRDPAVLVQQQTSAMLQGSDDADGNSLIQKLRQQSIDNRERNDLYVARKTFEADQSATFGPFDRQVLIMNTDGKTYTLLENPVAMRLKKAGFIDNQRSFIKQPTQADLDAASVTEPGLLDGLFAGMDASASRK